MTNTLLRQNFDFHNKTNEISLFLDTIFPKRSVKKVLFIQPPDTPENLFDADVCQRKLYPHYPPYGPLVLSSILRNNGIETQLLDLNHSLFSSVNEIDFDYITLVEHELKVRLAEFQPDLVCVSCMFSYSHNSLIKICKFIKQINSQCPIAIGGVHVTNSVSQSDTADKFFSDLHFIDIISLYEGDVSLLNLVEVINQKRMPHELSQTILQNRNDQRIFCTNRSTPDLSLSYDYPAFDLVPLSEYSKYGSIGNFYYLKNAFKSAATVLSNRGCRAQCTFCSVRSFNGVGVRRRNASSVINELKILRYEHDIDHIMWLDDDFFYDHPATLNLLNEIEKSNLGITWDCSNGVLAASCTEEIISASASSGCIGLHIGLESGNREILKKIKKPGTPDVFLRASEVLHKFPQIYVRALLMIGFENETWSQILDTIQLAKKCGFDWNTINVLELLPNTAMWNDSQSQQTEDKDDVPVDFESIQYVTNPIKFKNNNSKKDSPQITGSHFSSEFQSIFENANINSVPSKEDLRLIRSYMDFFLNFAPLLEESNINKLILKARHLEHIVNVVSPNNAIAMWFLAEVQMRLNNNVNEDLIARFHKTLDDFPSWSSQLTSLNLPITRIRNYVA